MKVIKHWEGLSQSHRPNNKSYKTLVKHSTDPLMPTKFKFSEYIASVFEPCLTLFQTDAPLIPFMYEQLKEIYDKLLSMVFKIDSLEQVSTSKKLKASWLNKKKQHLENGLVNVGAATKSKLKAAKVLLEKKRKFRGVCKAVILNILIKFAEKWALVYRFIGGARCFNLLNMVRHHVESSQFFKTLADHLFALHKTKASVADKSKSQMNKFLKMARFVQKEKFKNFDFHKDRLDVFFGDHLSKHHEVVCTLLQKGASQSTKR